jgi:hypothetical protein
MLSRHRTVWSDFAGAMSALLAETPPKKTALRTIGDHKQWLAQPCASTSWRRHCERTRAVQQPVPSLPTMRHPGAPQRIGLRPPCLLRGLRQQPLVQGDVRRFRGIDEGLDGTIWLGSMSA